MPRPLLAFVGAALIGAVAWFLIGMLAAILLSKLPGGSREGQGAMTGMFFVGPIFGLIAFIGSAWWLWRFSADPAHHKTILITFGVLLGLVVIGFVIALAPSGDNSNPALKGLKGKVEMEVRTPNSAPLAEGTLYEFRKGGGELSTQARFRNARPDGVDHTIVPGEFPLRVLDGYFIFAIMEHDKQRDVGQVSFPETPEPRDWSEWIAMDGGLQFRWRVLIDTAAR